MGGLLGECRNAVEGDDAETGRNEPERRAANRNGSATQSKRCRCGEAFARKRLRSGRLGYQHLCKRCMAEHHRQWRATADGRAKMRAGVAASKQRYPERQRVGWVRLMTDLLWVCWPVGDA